MRDPALDHPSQMLFHAAWSELSLISVALSSILAATHTGAALAGPSRPASDDWLRAYV